MLQACLNGWRNQSFHPWVPQSAEELARDAVLAIEAGASELHVHPRGGDGRESLDFQDVARCLLAIRASVPRTPIGISTHWGIPPGGGARQGPMHNWTVLPDYVSVNLVEEDAPAIIDLMLEKGIGIEAGLWSVADVERFLTLPAAPRCLRILIEINEQDIAEGMAVYTAMRERLARTNLALPILLHGFEATMWPLYHEAVKEGFDARIGLEDGELLPSGEVALDNAELLRAARLIAGSGAAL